MEMERNTTGINTILGRALIAGRCDILSEIILIRQIPDCPHKS